MSGNTVLPTENCDICTSPEYLCFVLQGGARSIHTAARYGHVGIINTLLQKGEKVDVTTNVSMTFININSIQIFIKDASNKNVMLERSLALSFI